MAHYDDEREMEDKHEIEDVDMSDYTNEQWFDELQAYLTDVMGMNKAQLKAEFDKRFPDLLVRDLFTDLERLGFKVPP